MGSRIEKLTRNWFDGKRWDIDADRKIDRFGSRDETVFFKLFFERRNIWAVKYMSRHIQK